MDIPINVVCSEQEYNVETRLLLTTKLRIPQPQPHTIVRPHLFIRLEQAFDTPLTLVIAPAGFGKTTLLASWLTLARQEARYPSAPAWLALDDHDNAPERLVHALIAAIQATQAQIGTSTRALLMSGSDPEVALQELIREITQTTRPLLLVIDEIHLLTMPAAVAILATLIAHQPPALHLILAGRTDPQLPLTRLRASGQLSELRATDLRLSNDETAAFLSQTMGLTLTALQVAQLIQRVEGWVAGFQLIALALRQATDPVTHAAALAGRHRFVLDYLFDEVLSRQAPEVQHFLLHTAILDRLCDSLCDAMLEGIGDQPAGPPHAASILESLERSSLFLVPLDGEQRWYRYHHLFADLLRHQLRQHHPKRVADLHRRAASWFAENGFVDAALHHAFAGGDSPLAATLIAVEGRTRLIRGELATLRGWLAALPEALVAACPRLTLLRAWTLVWSYQPAALEQLLESIDGVVPAAMAEILVLRAFVASSRNDWPAAQQLSRQALHAASAEPLLNGFIYAGMGDLAWVTGDTLEAIECHRCALECACRSGSLIQLADATHSLAQFEILQGQLSAAEATCAYGAATEPFGELLALSQAAILYARNELAAARTAVEQSLPLASRCGLCAYESFIHVELARISAAQGDTLTARQELLAGLQGTQRIVAQSGNRTPIWVAILRLREVEIGLSLGDLPTAARWAIQHWTPPDPQARMDLLLRQYALAQVLVACSDQPALLDRLCTQTGTPLTKLAAQLIASCEQRFSTMGLGTLLVEIHTLSTVLHAYDGRQPQALGALLRAIGLAMPEGIVRPFISRGAPMQRLLVAALTQWSTIPEQHEQHRYARHLLAIFPPHFVTCVLKRSCTPDPVGPQYPDRIAEPLSSREREVMRLLATGLSHREIATALTIAPDTARTHIKNIYGKLQVQNRVQALVRARELNLV